MLLATAGACRLNWPPPLTPALSARARLLRIEDTRRDEPSLVDSLLRSPIAEVRARAALATARIGARAHLSAVRTLASDPDPFVASNALFALGLFKDTGSVALASSSLRAGAQRGTEGAWLLGELGEAGRAPIVTALADPAVDAGTRGQLLLAATRLRPVPAAAIVPHLASADSALSWRAAYAISRGRSAAGARALLGLAGSPWASTREQVARAATRALTGDTLALIAREALTHLVQDTSARVRVNAVRAIATFGPDGRAAVVTALRDADVGVRVVAAQSLDGVLDSASAGWIAAFDADTSFLIRREIANGALRRGINLAERGEWNASDDWRLRAAAVELAGRGNAASVELRLARLKADGDGRVRAALAGAFAALADSPSVRAPVRARLRTMLVDEDIGVRSAALGGLRRGATVEDLAIALNSYHRSLSDRDIDARLAFWAFADSATRRGPLPDSVEARLRALPRPLDPLERMAAARLTRFSGWRDSLGTARPLVWYEDRARESADSPPLLRITTDYGTLELELFAADAPLTVYNIVSLAGRRYFDGQSFHRVVPNFVVQMGDPRGDGSGGPGYAIRDEINPQRYGRGTLGMALSGPNTGGSQFFVTHSPQPHLDGGYTVFGQVLSGWDVLDRIAQGDRIVRVTVR